MHEATRGRRMLRLPSMFIACGARRRHGGCRWCPPARRWPCHTPASAGVLVMRRVHLCPVRPQRVRLHTSQRADAHCHRHRPRSHPDGRQQHRDASRSPCQPSSTTPPTTATRCSSSLGPTARLRTRSFSRWVTTHKVAGLGAVPQDTIINGQIDVFPNALDSEPGPGNCGVAAGSTCYWANSTVNFWRSLSNVDLNVMTDGNPTYVPTPLSMSPPDQRR